MKLKFWKKSKPNTFSAFDYRVDAISGQAAMAAAIRACKTEDELRAVVGPVTETHWDNVHPSFRKAFGIDGS